MNFFNKHMNYSSSLNVTLNPSPIIGKKSELSRFREFKSPQSVGSSVPYIGNTHPLAESTPLNPAAIARNERERISQKYRATSQLPQQSLEGENQMVNVSDVGQSGVTNFENVLIDDLNVKSAKTKEKQQESTEVQMGMLYESLQSEAQKIQKFKVHALAQIKQKSDEISLKESQIKKLSIELSSIRSTSQHLTSRLQRQKHNNEDIMNKVATTREMCFALAGEHQAIKDHIDLGKTVFDETQQKSSSHSLAVNKTLMSVDQFRATVEQKLSHVEEMVKLKKVEQDSRIEELCRKEKFLLKEIDEKNAACQKLEITITNNAKQFSILEEDLMAQRETSKSREAELTMALDQLDLSKNQELSAIQQTLEETIAAGDKREQELLDELDSTKVQLTHCQTDLETTRGKLENEIAEIEQMTSEKDICEQNLISKEECIAKHLLAKAESDQSIQLIKAKLDEKIESLEKVTADLEQERLDRCEMKAIADSELLVKSAEISKHTSINDDLKVKLSSLDESLTELQSNFTTLQSENTRVSGMLKSAEDEMTDKIHLLDSQSKELDSLKTIFEKTSTDANAEHNSMKQSIEQLTNKYKLETEVQLQKIGELELELQKAKFEIESLSKKHLDEKIRDNEEISNLKQSLKSQQCEFDCTIKQKTDAFTKVQDELQRMLDESINSHNEKMCALREAMNTQKMEFDSTVKQRTDEFTEAQVQLQTLLSEAEKKLELENQKVDDITQDLTITKQSLDKSLQDKNTVAFALANKTEECQDVSNRLLVKECEFGKLMCAVQNLKSRWAAVATPIPSATPLQFLPQQAAVKPTSFGTPLQSNFSSGLSTPTMKSVTPIKGRSGATTPQNTTPRSAGSREVAFSTPRTPNSSLDNPKGILRNEGSASKPNRVVFSTPIEKKNVVPSDSDTSVLDIEVVNKSLQVKSTPEGNRVNVSRASVSSNSSQQRRNSLSTPKKCVTTSNQPNDGQRDVTPRAVTPHNQQHLNSSISPALSSQGGGDRLPRSKMIKAGSKKRLRPTGTGGRKEEESGMLAKTMKKHRSLMDHGQPMNAAMPIRPMNAAMPMRESDSDCFGFGSE